MNIAILGYGVEGKSAAAYFIKHGHEVHIFEHFDPVNPPDTSTFDLVFRSPSIPPRNEPNWTSSTKYFFAHCPCKVIGVTGTKGKGTTCSLITSILQAAGHTVHLLGNIGTPALDLLDDLQQSDLVVYEMSSFQLWDLTQSPSVAVVLRIEPDHLNVHKDFADYVSAKGNITRWQGKDDTCIYYGANPDSQKIARLSPGHQLPYGDTAEFADLLSALTLPGQHNAENATAAILAARAALPNLSDDAIRQGLRDFHGLPHRLQFLRELNSVEYYDDNYSTTFASLDVAVATFADTPTVVIAGGYDKGTDLQPIKDRLFRSQNVKQAILIGQTAAALAAGEDPTRYTLADSLESAVAAARETAEALANPPDNCLTDHPAAHKAVVVMSPAFASFDMFDSYGQRGDLFQALVKDLA